MGRRAAKAEVELVEDDGTGRGGVPPTPTPPADDETPGVPQQATRRGRRRATVLGATLLVVLVVAGVTGQTVVAGHDRARRAALSDLPGVLQPLDGPPQALWSSDDMTLSRTIRTAAGLQVATTDGPDGATARAFDARTGAVVWETELLGAAEVLTTPPGWEDAPRLTGIATCHEVGTARELACLVDNSLVHWVAGAEERVPATVTRLLVLDPRDGSVVDDLSAGVDDALTYRSVAVVGDLLVMCGLRGEEAHVSALDRDGTVPWRTTIPVEAAGFVYVETAGDTVVVSTPDTVRVLDASGSTVHSIELDEYDHVWGGAGDAVVLRTGGRGEESTTVLRGAAEVTVRGAWAVPTVDDGSVPGLLLTSDARGLHAWDARGEPLWTATVPLSVAQALVVLDGRVHLPRPRAMVTLDVATGHELGRTTDAATSGRLSTDGRVLVGLSVGGDEVVGVDPADGTVLWRSRTPSRFDLLEPVSGMLVGFGYGLEAGSAGQTPEPHMVVLG